MGEFLLNILRMTDAGDIVFAKKIKFAKFKVGDPVPVFYPHGYVDETSTPFIRICYRSYKPHVIEQLLLTGDPNVVDQDGFIKYQRELRDEAIHTDFTNGKDLKTIAYAYNWHPMAIMAAVERHKARADRAKSKAIVAAAWITSDAQSDIHTG